MRISDWSSDVCSSDLGEASVRVGEQEVARLVAGRFVGEIGFLALRPATATAIATAADEQQACRCLAWKAAKLRHRLARDPAMKSDVCRSRRRPRGKDCGPECESHATICRRIDRKSVGTGKSVSVLVNPGGRRILKKQTT